MIPYFSLTTIQIGPVPIQVWGLCVALGIVAATFLAVRLAKRQAISGSIIYDAGALIVVAGLIGARLGHVVLYEWAHYVDRPWEMFMVWQGGFSSLGGFMGGALALVWFVHRKRLSFISLSDTLLSALPLGWAIGRIGCFLIHDHPGTLTDHWLGVQYPGGTRFDLGLIESITGIFIFATALPLFLFWGKKKPGLVTAVVLLEYGAIRFWTDFLRATDLTVVDVRWWGLTPAQYGSVVVFLLGMWLVVRMFIKKRGQSR